MVDIQLQLQNIIKLAEEARNNITSKSQLLNTNSRRYLQYFRRFTKHYSKWYGKTSISYPITAGRQVG